MASDENKNITISNSGTFSSSLSLGAFIFSCVGCDSILGSWFSRIDRVGRWVFLFDASVSAFLEKSFRFRSFSALSVDLCIDRFDGGGDRAYLFCFVGEFDDLPGF